MASSFDVELVLFGQFPHRVATKCENDDSRLCSVHSCQYSVESTAPLCHDYSAMMESLIVVQLGLGSVSPRGLGC